MGETLAAEILEVAKVEAYEAEQQQKLVAAADLARPSWIDAPTLEMPGVTNPEQPNSAKPADEVLVTAGEAAGPEDESLQRVDLEPELETFMKDCEGDDDTIPYYFQYEASEPGPGAELAWKHQETESRPEASHEPEQTAEVSQPHLEPEPTPEVPQHHEPGPRAEISQRREPEPVAEVSQHFEPEPKVSDHIQLQQQKPQDTHEVCKPTEAQNAIKPDGILKRARSKQQQHGKDPVDILSKPSCIQSLPVLSPAEQAELCKANSKRAANKDEEEEDKDQFYKPKRGTRAAKAKPGPKPKPKTKAKAKAKAAAKQKARRKALAKAKAKAKVDAKRKKSSNSKHAADVEDIEPPAAKKRQKKERANKAGPEEAEEETEIKARDAKARLSRKSAAYHRARKAALEEGYTQEEAKAEGKKVS